MSGEANNSQQTKALNPCSRMYRLSTAPVSALCYVPKSSLLLLAGDQNGQVTLLHRPSRRALHAFEAAPSSVLSLWALDNITYVVQTRSAGVAAYDFETHQASWTVATGSASFCRCAVRQSPEASPLVACANEHESTLALWDVRTPGDPVWRATPNDKCGMLMETRFIGSEHVAGVYEDGTLRVFSVKLSPSSQDDSHSELLSLAVQPDASVATSFDVVANSPPDRIVGFAGGASDQLAAFKLNLASGVGEATLFAGSYTPGKGMGINMLRIRQSDRRVAAIASWDGRTRMVHVRTSRHLAALRDFIEAVQCVAFSPDGTQVASGGNSGIAEYFNLFPL